MTQPTSPQIADVEISMDTSTSETVTQFVARFQRDLATALNVPYEKFAADYADVSRYDDPRMAKAKALIYRAATAKALMRCGWRRKLKRARRIQRDVFGARASNLWFCTHWFRAWERAERIYRWSAWQDRIYEALMGDQAIICRPRIF